MIDATRAPGKEEIAIVEIVKKAKRPVICCLNKNDVINRIKMDEARDFLTTNLPDAKILSASAKNDDGVDEILIELFKLSPEGELMYPLILIQINLLSLELVK